MTLVLDWIIGADTFALSGRNPYAFVSLTGLGLPPVRNITERGPQQHGSTRVGFLLDERMMNLAILIRGETLAEVDGYRDALADKLKPADDLGKLRLTRDGGTVRQIDCSIAAAVDFPITDQERIGTSQLVIIQFMAPDPIPYDPSLRNIIFTIATGAGTPGGFEVPTMIPMLSSVTTSIDDVETLTYAGKWETFPVIYLTGPADDPVITNEATGKVLDFTGFSVPNGDTWVIDLRYGHKDIRNNAGALQNAALSDQSDLVTWSLAPAPQAPGGINDIHVEIPSGVTAATKVRIEFYDKYPNLG